MAIIDSNVSRTETRNHLDSTTIHVTSTEKSTWNGKQNALVSGTNIRTLGGVSILGSGSFDLSNLLSSESGNILKIGADGRFFVAGTPAIEHDSSFWGYLPWSSGPLNPAPSINSTQVLSGTGVDQTTKPAYVHVNYSFPVGTEGWYWFASKWGDVTTIEDWGLGSGIAITPITTYFTKTVLNIDGTDYTIYVSNQAGEPNGFAIRFNF